MMKIGKWHQRLAYTAAAVAIICVILAGISRLVTQNLVITIPSYMSLATVALLFAIYFLVQGVVSSGKR